MSGPIIWDYEQTPVQYYTIPEADNKGTAKARHVTLAVEGPELESGVKLCV
jgi:hypothetical protein